ncbi:CIPC [Cervus elaphus hippelaphus]|uniref:CIPC n=1 Tax=Cervus elaphus hippelaphus TaxID=46360 RepID=A0A212CV29_CEREH|nr:CIPC [Cervus elaphus hippelaphus]
MEMKNPSREGSRRLSAKPSKGSEMKKASRHLGLAAAESDKDSGFSECLSSAEQMESEDMLSALGWSREDRPRPSSKPASGAFPTLSPMVVMKNVLVKQVRRTALVTLCTLEFLSFLCTEFLSTKEGCEKQTTRNHTNTCHSPGKRASVFFVVGVVAVPEGGEQPAVAGEEAGPAEPTLHGVESSSPLSPPAASYSSALWAAEHFCRSPDSFPEQRQSKHRRFQNTLVVLHKSGLLEITLKTKELIRQNQATQVELDQLKEQTRLFIEATKSRAPQAWARLQASLTSGSGHTSSDLEAFSEQPDI